MADIQHSIQIAAKPEGVYPLPPKIVRAGLPPTTRSSAFFTEVGLSTSAPEIGFTLPLLRPS